MRYEIEQDGTVIIHMQNVARTEAWVERIAPGETERAAALLDADGRAAAQKAWTAAKIAAWRKAHPDYVAPPLPEPEPPSVEERLAEIEARLAALEAGMRG